MKHLKQKVAALIGNVANVHIVPKARQWAWAEDLFSAELLRRLEVDCVFDVGANEGQFGQNLRHIGYQGLILSFEPGPEAFAKCRDAAAADGNWHSYNYALSDAAGVLPFNIMTESKLSSFLAPLSGEDRAFATMNNIVETVNVDVYRLDDIYAKLKMEFNFEHPFLKIDTQGFDLKVAAGAGEVLKEFKGVLTEMGITMLYQDSPTMIDSLAAFREWGFDPIGFYSVHPGILLKPHEFNCYLLRRDLAEI